MLGSTLYLVGIEVATGELVADACCCQMCKRLVINAGIEKVVIRRTPTEYSVIDVSSWIDDDDSLGGKLGY